MRAPTEIITSRQNSLLTLVSSLAERKHRVREGLFRFDGKKLLAEALDAGVPLTAVLWKESSAETLRRAFGSRELPDGCRSVILPDALFDRISEEKSPEGVICVSRYLDKIHKIIKIGSENFGALLKDAPVLFLESVRDPGNLGTIIRSAGAFSPVNLVISADCADLYNPRTIRAAMGVLFRIEIFVVENVPEAIKVLANRGRVFAAALQSEAERLSEVVLEQKDTVMIGNEGHGLSAAALGASDRSLFIPMESGVESLNAGIAASLVLWEFYRRRG